MKKDIHPASHPVIFKDISAGTEFIAESTITTSEKETRKGVEYYVYRLDVSSASHPFYTGQSHYLDTAGRVEKFKAKQSRATK